MTASPFDNYPPGLLGVPAMEWIWTEAAVALVQLTHWLPIGSQFTYMGGLHSIAHKRNSLANTLLKNPALQWCLFMDSDAVPPHDVVLQLLRHDVGIVAATFCLRGDPYPEAHSDPIGAGPNGLLEVEDVGFHCTLVHRRVLERMSPPWFDHPQQPGVGEDTDFCIKARAAGFRIYVDPTVEVGHFTTMNVTPASARAYQATPPGAAALARAHERFKAARAALTAEAAP